MAETRTPFMLDDTGLRAAVQRSISLARVSSWIHSGGTGPAPTNSDYELLGVELANGRLSTLNESLTSVAPSHEAWSHTPESSGHSEESALFDRWVSQSPLGQSLYDERALSLAKIAAFAVSKDVPLDPVMIPSESDYLNAGFHGIFDGAQGIDASLEQVNSAMRTLSPVERSGLILMAAAIHDVAAKSEALQLDNASIDQSNSEQGDTYQGAIDALLDHQDDGSTWVITESQEHQTDHSILDDYLSAATPFPTEGHAIEALNTFTPASGYIPETGSGKIDLMSLLGDGRNVLVANVDGLSYEIFTDKPADANAIMSDQATPETGDIAVQPLNFQAPYDQDQWRFHFG